MGFFKKKNKMSIEEYAYYNLYIISNGAGNFFENNKDFYFTPLSSYKETIFFLEQPLMLTLESRH